MSPWRAQVAPSLERARMKPPLKGMDPGFKLLGLECSYVDAHGFKGSGVAFPFAAGKNILGRDQLNIYESGLRYRVHILSFQESAADSSSPEVDVGFGSIRNRLVHHDVR